MLTMRPSRRAPIAFLPKAWQRKNIDFRLTSMTSSQSASERSTASPRRMMPALLTSPSSGPELSQTRSSIEDAAA